MLHLLQDDMNLNTQATLLKNRNSFNFSHNYFTLKEHAA